MGAPVGNEYYKLRTKLGRENSLTPKELLDGANLYFQWCIDNPLIEQQIVKGTWVEMVPTVDRDEQGQIVNTTIKVTHPYSIALLNKMRPYTIGGLCNFLEIVVNTFKNYEKQKAYLTIITRIRQIIYNQKFEGAAAGFLDSRIIARDLGLVDKKDVTRTKKIIKVTMKKKED